MTDDNQRPFVLVMEGDAALGNTLRHSLATDFDVDLAETMVDAEALIGKRRYSMLLCELFIDSGGPAARCDGSLMLIGALRNTLLDFPAWGREVPILAMTSVGSVNGFDPLRAATGLGADHGVRKPFLPSDVCGLVASRVGAVAVS